MPKKILIIGTGGTISSIDTGEGLFSSLSVEEILYFCNDQLKDLDFQADIKDIINIDSTLIQPEDWIKIAEEIELKYPQYDGFVILHGTDTLAYTASMLSFMLRNPAKPIVFTGSMKPAPIEHSDAINNVADSIRFAVDGCHGVFVVFNHKVIRAPRASKIASESVDAFASVNEPPFALITSRDIKYNKKIIKTTDMPFFVDTLMDNNVFVIKVFPGLEPSFVESITANKNIFGIVVESYGAGGLPYRGRNLLEVLAKVAHKIPVVLTSQVVYDGVNLKTYEVGLRAYKAGVISARDMTKEATITKLMWLLGHTRDIERIRKFFEISLAGEVSPAEKAT